MKIAQETNLLPKTLTWASWTSFVTSFTDHIDTKFLYQVARRYQYGELRLSRLNRIYRYTPSLFSPWNLFRGFLAQSTWYQDTFHRNFGWLLAVFAVFSVVLSGMQVGLATDQLGRDATFHRVSHGFAVFSLAATAGFLLLMVLTWVVLMSYFYISAKLYHHRIQSLRRERAAIETQG